MNLDLLRSFFLVAELGSLNKAAERLRVSQSTLTRQMHALEHEIGGALFERSSTGVALTATGNALLASAQPALAQLDGALGEARRLARGQSDRLRIGYLLSAVSEYVNPALAALRKAHPEVKVKMLDLSPGEQLAALRKGEIDLAILASDGAVVNCEFYARRIATVPVFAALAETHPLAIRPALSIADLKRELFIGAAEADVPGHNRWIMRICREAGFRPRFVGDAESLGHGLSMVVSEEAVGLVPEYAAKTRAPGVVFVPVRDARVRAELLLAWQRGKLSAPLRTMIEAIAHRRPREKK